MAEALEASGPKTKKEVVEAALMLHFRRNPQQQVRELQGKPKWESLTHFPTLKVKRPPGQTRRPFV